MTKVKKSKVKNFEVEDINVAIVIDESKAEENNINKLANPK